MNSFEGAYELSISTFKLVGVSPHVWGIVTPWLVIILVLAIYLIFVLAWRFVQIMYFKSVQDKVKIISNLESYEFRRLMSKEPRKRKSKSKK